LRARGGGRFLDSGVAMWAFLGGEGSSALVWSSLSRTGETARSCFFEDLRGTGGGVEGNGEVSKSARKCCSVGLGSQSALGSRGNTLY
jgi:hypothetical protein